MSLQCALCGEPVNPSSPTTFTRIVAWERKGLSATRRGGSDIVLREPRDEHAHGHCVERQKLGVPAAQESLSL